jgi:subtilisin family serine protease
MGDNVSEPLDRARVVTAIDANEQLMPQANQGPHIALAAPGINVLEPAANAGYQLTTGTSVAAAHVTGVAALLIERKPDIDVAALEHALFSTAKDLGPKGRDSQFGFGLVDPYRALNELTAKVAVDQSTRQTPAPANANPPAVAMTSGSVNLSQLSSEPRSPAWAPGCSFSRTRCVWRQLRSMPMSSRRQAPQRE